MIHVPTHRILAMMARLRPKAAELDNQIGERPFHFKLDTLQVENFEHFQVSPPVNARRIFFLVFGNLMEGGTRCPERHCCRRFAAQSCNFSNSAWSSARVNSVIRSHQDYASAINAKSRYEILLKKTRAQRCKFWHPRQDHASRTAACEPVRKLNRTTAAGAEPLP